MGTPTALPEADWLGFCRRSADGVRRALARYETVAERAVETGTGEGGDRTLVIDRAAEDAVLVELEQLGVGCTVVSEECGELTVGGGGPTHVVIDPVDGSLNAKRGLPFASLSIAVASGRTLADVELGYVTTLDAAAREWRAERGGGAFADGERLAALDPGPLEVLALEVARPPAVAEFAPALRELEPRRIRALGSVASTLCLVAEGKVDAMVSLRPVRSVDAAAGALIVREAGGFVEFLEGGDDGSLGLELRTRIVGARDAALVERLRQVL